MFGWDWGPQLPDMGILGDVVIESYSKARIKEVYFDQIHEGHIVKLCVDPVLYITDNIPLEIVVDVEGQKSESKVIRMPEAGEHNIPRGQNEMTIDIVNPELWWPNGMGEQKLYKVRIRVKKSETIYDERTYNIGLRTITVSTEKDNWGKEFAFVINGVKMFAMGADYIPEDAIYTRITDEKIHNLIKSASKANFNCIRVWGGGYYPSDTFYDYCDKYGLVVWQDLMFACNVYDMTSEFEKNIVEETRDNVTRLRHHACLGLFCGNNENESAWVNWEGFKEESSYLKADYIKMFEHVLPNALREADDRTFYWPSSPSSGGCFDAPEDENRGDAHYWEVWHGQKPFTEYRKHYFRFLSEFGFQSFPSIKTVSTYAEPEDRNIFSKVMEAHQKNGAANGKILYYISENFLYPSNFEGLLYVSQILQGMAIKYGVEHFRRNRGRCMGTLFWQLNDNWPVASWSSIDYFGRWKALQYMAKRFFEPVAGSVKRILDSEDGRDNKFQASIVNDSPDAVSFKVRMSLYDMNGKEIIHYDETGRSLPGKVSVLKEHDFERYVKNHGPENLYIETEFAYTNGVHRYETETFIPYKHLNLLAPSVNYSVLEYEDYYEITIESDVFTPFVFLELKTRDGVFEDNVFNLTAKRPFVTFLLKESIIGEQYSSVDELCKDISVNYLQKSYMQFEDTPEEELVECVEEEASEITEEDLDIQEEATNEETDEIEATDNDTLSSETQDDEEEDFFDDEIEYPEYKREINNVPKEPVVERKPSSEVKKPEVMPRLKKLDGIRIR